MAVSGDDFSIIASDTRLSENFCIFTRNSPKVYRLTDKTYLASTGNHGDVLTLIKLVEARLQMYEHEHNQPMSTGAIAAMLSTILYYRRFFPYYVYNIIGGVDDQGKGCVYSYDPIGSYEREVFRAAGTAGSILQPLLDNQIGFKNQHNVEKKSLSVEKALALVKDVFISAAERDISTGDNIDIVVIKHGSKQVERHSFPVRRD